MLLQMSNLYLRKNIVWGEIKMSNFEVDYLKLKKHASDISNIYQVIKSLKQQIDTCTNNLRSCMPASSYNNIRKSLNSVSNSMQQQSTRLNNLSNALDNISVEYSGTEKRVYSTKIGISNLDGTDSNLNLSDSWFNAKSIGDESSSFFKFISKLLENKDWFNGKYINQAAKLGLVGYIFSYLTGLYTFWSGEYKDGFDLTSGVLGFIKSSGSMWTGLYKYYDKMLTPYQAGRLGKVFQTKAGVVSLIGSLCGFTKDTLNTYKILSNENSEGFEKINQILKNTTSGLDVVESGFALKYGQKILTKGVNGKYVWGLSGKNASAMGKASATISVLKVGIDTVIGGNAKYNEVSRDGFVSSEDMADVLMSGSVRGLTSIVDTATFGLVDVKDYSDNISSAIKNTVVDPATSYAVNNPVSRAYIEKTSSWAEFSNNPDNPEWQRWGVSIVSGIGMIGAMATDVVTTPHRLVYSGIQTGYNALTSHNGGFR